MTHPAQRERPGNGSRVIWMPNPGAQAAFLACPVREILYGGAKGGGKTDAIGPLVLRHLAQHGQYAAALVLRATYPELTELMARIEPLARHAGGTWNKTEKTWRFPNGSRLLFGHLTRGCDPYWGQEYTMIVIDELTRAIATEVEYLKLLGSLRSSHGIPCRVIATSNPGGEGHNWVQARFMQVPPLTVQSDQGLERVYIPAGLGDNPHLEPEYRAVLEQLPDAERRAFLDGDWDAFRGAVFHLVPGVHIWSWQQFHERTGHGRPPKEWTRFRTMDWGFAHPFAVYWYAMDHDGRAYVYREFYGIERNGRGGVVPNSGARMTPTDVAICIRDAEEGERIDAAWAGPDIAAAVRGDHMSASVVARGGGETIESRFNNERIFWQYWTATENSRLAGKMALHQRLAYQVGDDGRVVEYPGLVFIAEECPHAIRTLPLLEYDAHRPELVSKAGEDHAFDSISGFCKMKPWAPPPPKLKVATWQQPRRQRSGWIA